MDEDASFLELSQQAGLGMEYGDIPNACVVAGVEPVHGHLCMVSNLNIAVHIRYDNRVSIIIENGLLLLSFLDIKY